MELQNNHNYSNSENPIRVFIIAVIKVQRNFKMARKGNWFTLLDRDRSLLEQEKLKLGEDEADDDGSLRREWLNMKGEKCKAGGLVEKAREENMVFTFPGTQKTLFFTHSGLLLEDQVVVMGGFQSVAP